MAIASAKTRYHFGMEPPCSLTAKLEKSFTRHPPVSCVGPVFPEAQPDFHGCVRGIHLSFLLPTQCSIRRTCRADGQRPEAPSASAADGTAQAGQSATVPLRNSRLAHPAVESPRLVSSFAGTAGAPSHRFRCRVGSLARASGRG